MRTRLVQLAILLAPLASASATDLFPTVQASIHDAPVDGAGDTFNATPFQGLVRKGGATQEDRAIQEFDVSAFTGASLASATISGTVSSNNAFDVGVRTFDFVLYAGNGVADLSDYQIAAVSVGTASYHPPLQTSLTYSFDATAAAQALLSGGATWIGLRVQPTTDPNFPNLLDDTTSRLTLVAGSTGTPFCFGDGSGTVCPCGNAGLAGNGCASSAFAVGAKLTATGTAGASAGTDTLVLTAANVSGPGLFFQGTTPFGGGSGVAFGDGLLCAGGSIVRMGVVFPSGSTAIFPGGLTPNPIHVAGAPIAPGDVRLYQCWYRDAVPFCSAQTFNLTPGIAITFGP